MAFFKSFQESLSSVSVSSILDSVSSTVSNTVDGVRTAVNDVTYTVSDQLTEQVNTIINKKQGEDEDKGKKDEGEKDSESRTGAAGRINSKRQAYADEEEEQREREKQEQERRNEEEQWEWCYAPSKGWYRKRRDPNQRETNADRQENKDERTGASTQPSPLNGDMNLQKVKAVRMENDEGGQKDTISKTSAETPYCKDTGAEPSPESNNKQTNGHTPEGHTPDGNTPEGHTPDGHTPEGHTPEGDTPEGHTPEGHTPEGHTQNRYAQDKNNSDRMRNSTSTKPKQNTAGVTAEDGADEGGADEERQLPQEEDSQEGETGCSRSRGSSVLKGQHDGDDATGSQDHLEVTEFNEDRKNTDRSFKKERFRHCTIL
ncbi:hypothetical protein Q7C36_003585 [Tachysurus vachellii]|uniref:Uncharacterized protein n=1 Tax=Tachysurus vachellii TaxID=175792 RepID=A0AA88NTR5_TACVA|nr:hypothetical protein Q7C36_003585 [Tachysurus vachellii]